MENKNNHIPLDLIAPPSYEDACQDLDALSFIANGQKESTSTQIQRIAVPNINLVHTTYMYIWCTHCRQSILPSAQSINIPQLGIFHYSCWDNHSTTHLNPIVLAMNDSSALQTVMSIWKLIPDVIIQENMYLTILHKAIEFDSSSIYAILQYYINTKTKDEYEKGYQFIVKYIENKTCTIKDIIQHIQKLNNPKSEYHKYIIKNLIRNYFNCFTEEDLNSLGKFMKPTQSFVEEKINDYIKNFHYDLTYPLANLVSSLSPDEREHYYLYTNWKLVLNGHTKSALEMITKHNTYYYYFIACAEARNSNNKSEALKIFDRYCIYCITDNFDCKLMRQKLEQL
jgi:hypothetical protein